MFRQTLGVPDVLDPGNLIEEFFVLSRKRVVDLFFDLKDQLIGGTLRGRMDRRRKKAAAKASGSYSGYPDGL